MATQKTDTGKIIKWFFQRPDLPLRSTRQIIIITIHIRTRIYLLRGADTGDKHQDGSKCRSGTLQYGSLRRELKDNDDKIVPG
jgi:hypothetical protein